MIAQPSSTVSVERRSSVRRGAGLQVEFMGRLRGVLDGEVDIGCGLLDFGLCGRALLKADSCVRDGLRLGVSVIQPGSQEAGPRIEEDDQQDQDEQRDCRQAVGRVAAHR